MSEDDRASDLAVRPTMGPLDPHGIADWGDPPPFERMAADRAADDPLSPLTEAGLLELLGTAGRAQRSLLTLVRMDAVSPAARQHARIGLQAVREIAALVQGILHPAGRRP